jgi:hypothetical protein
MYRRRITRGARWSVIDARPESNGKAEDVKLVRVDGNNREASGQRCQMSDTKDFAAPTSELPRCATSMSRGARRRVDVILCYISTCRRIREVKRNSSGVPGFDRGSNCQGNNYPHTRFCRTNTCGDGTADDLAKAVLMRPATEVVVARRPCTEFLG